MIEQQLTAREYLNMVSARMFRGLEQDLKLRAHRDYAPVGRNSSRVLTIELKSLNPGHHKKVKAKEKTLSVWAGLGQDQTVRVVSRDTTLAIEIPKPSQYCKLITYQSMQKYDRLRRNNPYTFLLGLGLQDEPIHINYRLPMLAHTFVAGGTRSGKTNLMRLLAYEIIKQATPDQARVLIYDVAKEGYKWSYFNRVPHLLHDVIVSPGDVTPSANWLVQEIHRRARTGQKYPRLFVFADEFKELVVVGEGAVELFTSIATYGGEFNVHLVLATQYPQIKSLGNDASLMRNITTRIVGRTDNKVSAAQATGIEDTGAEGLCYPGDMIMRSVGEGRLTRFTAAFLSKSDLSNIPTGEHGQLELVREAVPDQVPVVHRSHQPDPMDYEHVARALFLPTGTTALCKTLHIGSNKAKRVRAAADVMRRWCDREGIKELPETYSFLED